MNHRLTSIILFTISMLFAFLASIVDLMVLIKEESRENVTYLFFITFALCFFMSMIVRMQDPKWSLYQSMLKYYDKIERFFNIK